MLARRQERALHEATAASHGRHGSRSSPELLLETVGFDKVLFETDFPHPTSLDPGVQEHILDTLGGYDISVRKKVLETNAVKLYNLPC